MTVMISIGVSVLLVATSLVLMWHRKTSAMKKRPITVSVPANLVKKESSN